MRPAYAIAEYMQSLTPDQIVYVGTDVDIPLTPQALLNVVEAGGRLYLQHDGSLKAPTFQVTARADLLNDAAVLIDQVFDLFGGNNPSILKNILIGDVFFLHIRPTSPPFHLPNDANSRVRYALNLETLHR